MKIYKLIEFGDRDDDNWCFSDNDLEGIGLKSYKFAMAERLDPSDIEGEITLQLDEENKGLKKGAILGNTGSMLIVDLESKEVIECHCSDNVDFHKVKILDHKGRVHSDDYWVINPLICGDYINYEKSTIKYKNGELRSIRKMILDQSKVEDVPDIFRVLPVKSSYYISEKLKKALESTKISNFCFKEISVA